MSAKYVGVMVELSGKTTISKSFTNYPTVSELSAAVKVIRPTKDMAQFLDLLDPDAWVPLGRAQTGVRQAIKVCGVRIGEVTMNEYPLVQCEGFDPKETD